jgi:TAT (twin-arginine translocation) pathway signal sequence
MNTPTRNKKPTRRRLLKVAAAGAAASVAGNLEKKLVGP